MFTFLLLHLSLQLYWLFIDLYLIHVFVYVCACVLKPDGNQIGAWACTSSKGISGVSSTIGWNTVSDINRLIRVTPLSLDTYVFSFVC